MIEIDFKEEENYFDLQLPKPPYTKSPYYPDWPSAWNGLDRVLSDLLNRFNVRRDLALEFGVEFGYSTAALSRFFQNVTGVDTFTGDKNCGLKEDHFEFTSNNLKPWPNVDLIKSDYRDYIKRYEFTGYNLIHVDIIHDYENTFDCGLWAATHSNIAIFHDTESFPEVKRAVSDIAIKTGKYFYNYPKYYGLGILSNEKISVD